ncbi:MAG: NupC/NupG family nucleoside CNT transporter [Spirochaetes bacterium]|nr:NupC/NupG family nucleoside CNT transporter [Spirochaetota bacterium]
MIYKLQSLAGLVLILGLAFLLSTNKKSIKLRVVVWGFALQLILALIILRTDIGFLIFEGAKKAVGAVINYSDKGAAFVFGNLVYDQAIGAVIAFRVLPIIIFVSALMGILSFFGIIQFFVKLMARLMQRTMKISGAESLGAAMLIFMGIESSTGLKEYIRKMTRSEIFVYMSAFMSTIATSVMATYVSFGAQAGHLLAASIMSAPAAVAIAKIMIPETEKPDTLGSSKLKLETKPSNIIESMADGASTGAHLAIQIGAMLLAFMGIIYLINGLLNYAGLSMDKIFSYIFYPFALALGVPVKDASVVASLLGTKTVFNEFLAYMKLQPLIQSHAISARSIVISTYALCGFANFGSIAILIGGLAGIAPEKKNMIASLGIKSLIAGTLASFMTAIIAGWLI